MNFIDTHAHLIWDKFKGREESVINSASDCGVTKIITIGCDLDTIEKSKQCAVKFCNVWFSAGIHPTDAENVNIDWLQFESYLQHSKCIGVGECGFDFFHEPYKEEVQRSVFLKQIELSRKYGLPLIIHSRDAGDNTLEMLKKCDVKDFVIHCFTESLKFAEEIIKLGGMFSFGGIITYPKSDELREVLRTIPLTNIMLETDCPYLAPQSVRGKTNEPKYIVEIAKKIAKIKCVDLDTVAKITTKNAENFFNIS